MLFVQFLSLVLKFVSNELDKEDCYWYNGLAYMVDDRGWLYVLAAATPRSIGNNSRGVIPPGSGVPMPGA